MTQFRCCATLLISALALALTAAALPQSQQPSLGEVARSKIQKKAARVITNDELPKAEPGVNGAVAAPAAERPKTEAGVEKSKSNEGAKDTVGKPETPAADASQSSERQAELLREQIKAMEAKIEAESDPDARASLQNILENYKTRLAELQTEIESKKPAPESKPPQS